MAVATENPKKSYGFTVPCLTLSVGRLTSDNIERNALLCRNPLSESVPVMDKTPHNSTPCQLQEAGSSSRLKVNVYVAQRSKKKLKAQNGYIKKNWETVTIRGSNAIDGTWFLAGSCLKFSRIAIVDEQ